MDRHDGLLHSLLAGPEGHPSVHRPDPHLEPGRPGGRARGGAKHVNLEPVPIVERDPISGGQQDLNILAIKLERHGSSQFSADEQDGGG